MNWEASLNLQDKYGNTALHWAYKNNDSNEIRMILKRKSGIDENIKDHKGKKPEECNCNEGDGTNSSSACIARYIHCTEKVVKDADESVMNAIDPNNGNSLLHYAAIIGNNPVVQILLNHQSFDSRVNRPNEDGRTALALAALYGRVHVVTLLLELNNLEVNEVDNKGRTALHLAASANKHRVIEALMKCKKVNVAAKDENDNTALHCAAHSLSVEAFRLLLTSTPVRSTDSVRTEHFADRMCLNDQGWTPFHCVVAADRSVTEAVKCKKLLKYLKKPEYLAYANKADNQGRNLLHLAVNKNNCEIITLLKMVNPEKLNIEGVSPLHLAAQIEIKTSDDASRSMLGTIMRDFYSTEHFGDIDHFSIEGKSALMMCVELGFVENVKLLLENGSRLFSRSSNECSVLHKLVKCENRSSQVKIYNLILEKIVYCSNDGRKQDVPPENTDQYQNIRNQALKELIFGLKYEGLNVVQYAARMESFILLEEMIETLNDLGVNLQILTPKKSNHQHCMVCVEAVISEQEQNGEKKEVCRDFRSAREKSVLELLMNSKDHIGATDTLVKKHSRSWFDHIGLSAKQRM